MFRRGTKPPLEYALDFIEIAGETARRYLHDKDYIPTEDVFAQLKELEDALWFQHNSLRYIIRTLNERKAARDNKPGD